LNWNDLKYYLIVARVNNITEASKVLEVSPSTVARRITLFNKRPTGYFLSDAGKEILSLADETESSFQFLERKLTKYGSSKMRSVKIELPELLGQHFVVPKLLALRKSEPNISFEIVNSVKNSKLSLRESDVVIRLSIPENGAYTVRKVGAISQTAYCSEEYIREFGYPNLAKGISDHTFIGWSKEMRYLPLAKWFSELTENTELWLETSNYTAQFESVRAGLGIAALPKFIANKYSLKEAFVGYKPLKSDLWLLRNTETSSYEHVRVVANYIENIISSEKILNG